MAAALLHMLTPQLSADVLPALLDVRWHTLRAQVNGTPTPLAHALLDLRFQPARRRLPRHVFSSLSDTSSSSFHLSNAGPKPL